MASLLSILVCNLAERTHKFKCIMNMVKVKKSKTCGIKYKACEHEYDLEFKDVKDDLIE